MKERVPKNIQTHCVPGSQKNDGASASPSETHGYMSEHDFDTMDECPNWYDGCHCLEAKKHVIDNLKLVLSGQRNKTDSDRIALLEIAVKVGICGLYEHYKKDVLDTFTIEELQEVVKSTEPFKGFTVEHIYKTALAI